LFVRLNLISVYENKFYVAMDWLLDK